MPEGLGLVLPTKAMPFARTRLFSWPEKLRMARDVVWPRLLGRGRHRRGHVTCGGAWGRRWWSGLPGRWWAASTGRRSTSCSLDAVVPQLRIAEREHRSLLFAGLADGRAMQGGDRRRRPPGAKTPRACSSRCAAGWRRWWTLSGVRCGGAGADLRTACGVRSLSRAGTGVAARFADGSLGRFDGAIIAAPAPVAARPAGGRGPGRSRGARRRSRTGRRILVTLAYRRARGPRAGGARLPRAVVRGRPDLRLHLVIGEVARPRARRTRCCSGCSSATRGPGHVPAGGRPGRRGAGGRRADAADRGRAAAGPRLALGGRDAALHRGPPGPRGGDRRPRWRPGPP